MKEEQPMELTEAVFLRASAGVLPGRRIKNSERSGEAMCNRELTIKIIVATHKAYAMPAGAMYLPLQVGSAINAALP